MFKQPIYISPFLIIIIPILILFSQSILGQNQDLKIGGIIVDKNTHEPLPFTNIQVERTGIGTISDNIGRFSLKVPVKYLKNNILFSFIGYQTEVRKISDLHKDGIITMNKTEIELNEVIIMPKDVLLDLLKNAYEKIEINYPTSPSKLNGFYRETLKTPENQYLYFAEAVTETYKSSYKVKSDDGQVKILKSVINEFPGADTLNNLILYGGLFVANNGDFVKKREDFINPKFFKKYNYSVAGMTQYLGKKVYIISFDTQHDLLDGVAEGTIYIDQSSLAYVSCAFELTARGIKQANNIFVPFKWTKAKVSINYVEYNGKWHVKYIAEQIAGINTKFKSNLNLSTEYITTEIHTDSVKPIPFNERIDYRDIFSYKASDYYTDDYFSEYNTLRKDTLLENQIKPLYSLEQSKELLTLKVKQPKEKFVHMVLKNISVGYGIGYLPINFSSGSYQIVNTNGNKSIDFTQELKFNGNNFFFNVQFNYSLNKKWEITFIENKNIGHNFYFKSLNIGITRNFLLIKKTKPLILETSLLYSQNNIAQNFSTIKNEVDDFKFDNKTIDAHKIQFGIGSKTFGIQPKLALQYKIGKMVWISTSIGYYYGVKSSDKLFLQEKSGFSLTRRQANIDLTDNTLQITINGKQTTSSSLKSNYYNVSIGIMFRF
ncbi:MAG: carboxypeptidase-like regulatory domain-containing protein [Lentimicrobiaceae bacterium]|jgi:hypothetical protein